MESLSNTTFQNISIRVALDNTDKLYSEYTESNKYYSDSKEARTLISGTLEENGSVTHNLRIWIDEDTPSSEQNKIFASKIVVTTGEGEIIKHLADQVELGDYISMTPTSTNYVIPAGITGYESSQSINPSKLNLWRVISKNADGSVDVVSEYVSSDKVTFKGKTGYLNYVGVLNQIASQYTNEKYVQSTRHMGYNGQTEYITDTSKIDSEIVPWKSSAEIREDNENPPHGNKYENLGGGDVLYKKDMDLVENALGNLGEGYGIASRHYIYGTDLYYFYYVRVVANVSSNIGVYSAPLYDYYTNNFRIFSQNLAIRPILTLKYNNEIKTGDGKSSSTAYTFE